MQQFAKAIATSGDLIFFACLVAFRDAKGAAKCRQRGIGAARRLIGEPLPEEVGTIDPVIGQYAQTQRAAAKVLAGECARCKLKCRLARA